jgi:predicted RNase H-like nuclease (RuvC/YqgF family)
MDLSMESSSSSSSEDVQMEDMEVMNFLLRSKLACHEATYEKQEKALCHEKEEKKVLQQTVNDLISIAAEANMTIAVEPDISINVESDFSEEIENLKHELGVKNNAIGTLRSRLADLQQKVTVEDQQKEVLEEMNCQIFLLRSKLSSHETYFDELKKKLTRYEQALCHEKQEKTVLQQTVNDLISIAAEADITISVDPDISINATLIDDFSEEIENLEHELEEKNNAIVTFKSQLADLQQEVRFGDQQKEVLERKNCQIFLLQSKLSSHEMYFDELNEKLASHEATNQEQKQALSHEKEEKKVLQKTVNDLISIAAEADISIVVEPDVSIDLTDLSSDFLQEVTSLQSELEEKNTFITSLKTELSSLKQNVTKEGLQKEAIEEMNVQIFLLQSKLSSHEAYFDELNAKTQVEQERFRTSALEMMEQERSLNNQKNEQKSNQIASLQCRLDSSISNAKKFKAEVLQLQKTLSVREIKHLETLKLEQERSDEFDVEVFLLSSKLSSYERSHEEMQDALGLEKIKARCLTEQNANFLRIIEEEKGASKEASSNLRQELDSKTQIVSELKNNIANINEDLQNTFATIDRLQGEKSDTEETIHNLRNALDTSAMQKEKTSDLETQIVLGNKQIEDLKTEKEQYEVSLSFLKYSHRT